MKVKDIISFPHEWINRSKLHLAIGVKEKREPLYEFYKGKFKNWQEYQNRKNFQNDYIFSLVYYNKHEWLFAGVYKTKGFTKKEKWYVYDTELQDVGKEFIGRLIIRFEKKFRASYPYLKNHIDDLQLLEVLREPYTVEPFPGFENVKIDFHLLKSIIEQEEKTWKTALSNVKGIYLITDKFTGKLYVGSGYGIESLWTRWGVYAKPSHGGNKKLKELIKKEGESYFHNFQFSILETRTMKTDKDEIIKRENFWKEVLLTRKFGYNIN